MKFNVVRKKNDSTKLLYSQKKKIQKKNKKTKMENNAISSVFTVSVFGSFLFTFYLSLISH